MCRRRGAVPNVDRVAPNVLFPILYAAEFVVGSFEYTKQAHFNHLTPTTRQHVDITELTRYLSYKIISEHCND